MRAASRRMGCVPALLQAASLALAYASVRPPAPFPVPRRAVLPRPYEIGMLQFALETTCTPNTADGDGVVW